MFMAARLFLGEPLGWETESRSKVAIAQWRDVNPPRLLYTRDGRNYYNDTCPKAQLIKNEGYRSNTNLVKVLGYIPGLNIFMGIFTAIVLETSSISDVTKYHPHHTAFWRVRYVMMIIAGPLLLIGDLIKFVYDLSVIKAYERLHPEKIRSFDVAHNHTRAHWMGHPVTCL